jgi:hypothetical protein
MSAYQILRRGVTAIGVIGACIALGACSSSSDGGGVVVGPVTKTGIYVQVDSAPTDGVTDTIALVTTADGVLGSTAFDGGGGGSLQASNKSYFFDGNLFYGSGGNVWGFDEATGAPVARVDNPSFQANREGTVGQGQVNLKSSGPASVSPGGKNLRDYIGRTQLTFEEAKDVDMCDVMSLVNISSGATKAPADTIMHNMGYSPVGIDFSSDGKMVINGVREGDHLLFIDTDPASPTFATPVRFVIQRTGEIKDKSNAVVGTFTSQYAGFGGSAPGNLNHKRDTGATGGETDGETYVEPCDTNIIRNEAGEEWFGSVDVDGDTITLARVDTITSLTPTVVQFTVPVIDDNADTGGQVAFDYVGPWMGTMHNREGGKEMLLSAENQGENSESIFDVTNAGNPFEVERIITDLSTVKAFGGGTLGGPFVDGDTYSVNVDFTSTGGGPTMVDYTYNSLGGDDLTGLSLSVTTAILRKVNLADPGPNFILNGLNGRASTSESNFSSTVGAGTATVVYSDELWLPINSGPQDVFQIVDLSTAPPWPINRVCNLISAFGFVVTPENEIVQNVGGSLQVIDMASCTLVNTIAAPGGGAFRGGPIISTFTQ